MAAPLIIFIPTSRGTLKSGLTMSRVEHDHYPTPEWMTEQLLKFADIRGSVVELCAGRDHAIADVIVTDASNVTSVWTNDFYYGDHCDSSHDAADPQAYSYVGGSDWYITNPPFNQAQDILRLAHKHALIGVAMLLRVTADEMTMTDPDRYNWWADNPESLVIKMPRYSFARSSKSGNWAVDSAYCQWFVWRKDGYVYPQPVIRLPHDRIPGYSRHPVVVDSPVLIPTKA